MTYRGRTPTVATSNQSALITARANPDQKSRSRLPSMGNKTAPLFGCLEGRGQRRAALGRNLPGAAAWGENDANRLLTVTAQVATRDRSMAAAARQQRSTDEAAFYL